jgi:hypothetical protein
MPRCYGRSLRLFSRFMVEKIARFGYAAKGAVYLLIGYLTCYAAWSGRKPPSGSKGALSYLLIAPFGNVAVGLVAAGLVSYVVWRLIQAFLDPEHKRSIPLRAFYFGIASVYSSAALAAIRLIVEHRSTQDKGPAPLVAAMLAQPFGRYAAMILAAAILIFAGFQLKQGVTSSFMKKLELDRIPAALTSAAIWAGRIGLTARGLAFGTIAILVWRAALHANAAEAKGLGGALREFQLRSHGDALLGAIGLGLAIYGLYSFVLAAARRIDV